MHTGIFVHTHVGTRLQVHLLIREGLVGGSMGLETHEFDIKFKVVLWLSQWNTSSVCKLIQVVVVTELLGVGPQLRVIIL